MYEWLKSIILPMLRISDTQPHPPSGYDPHEFMQIMRASPKFLRYQLLFWKLYAVAWGFSILAISIALVVVNPWLTLVAIPLALIAAFKAATFYVTTRLNYEMRWYVITDRSLLIREGVWSVRELTLTFANAQNVRVTQGPLQRYFGFSNVEVETAGGASKQEEKGAVDRHRAVLRGLENPTEVRDMILEILRRQRGAGLGDPDDHHEHETEPLNATLLQQIWDESKLLHTTVKKKF